MMLGAVLAALALAAEPTAGDEPLLLDPAEASVPIGGALRWSFAGRGLVLAAADTTREPDEHALETLVGLDLVLGLELAPAWDFAFAARLRHHLESGPDGARSRLVPELREARATWHASSALDVTLGLVPDLRWPALVDPHPLDLALGPLPASGEAGDRRRPIPVAQVALQAGELRFEALWQPLDVAPRVALDDSDWAPLGDLGDSVGADDLAELERCLGCGAVGLRASWRRAVWDVGLAWLWRADPLPHRPDAAADASTGRQHVLGAELATTVGITRWRLEAAWHDAHTSWRRSEVDGAEPRGQRTPALEALLSVAAQPFIMLDGELSLRALHLVGAPRERAIGAGPDDLELRLRLMLLLAYDGVLRLDLEGRLALLRADGDLALAFGIRLGPEVEAVLGLTVYEGKGMDVGRGALYDADDQLWARVLVGF